MTGLVIVTTLVAQQDNMQAFLGIEPATTIDGASLVITTFSQLPLGGIILICGIVLFAYSTIIGWQYYGDRCITYLSGGKGLLPYKILLLIVGFVGALGVGDFLWNISDIMNALMAVPNIIVVLVLTGFVAKETRHYVRGNNVNDEDKTPVPTIK